MIRPLRVVLLAILVSASVFGCQNQRLLSFAPDSLPNGVVGAPYSAVITVSGNDTPVGNVSADSGLPPGLTLQWDENGDRNTAVLSGSPTASGTFDLTISAWCLGTNVNGQTGSRQYRIVVSS